MSVDPLTGELRWTPVSGQVGAHDVVLEVDDSATVTTQAGLAFRELIAVNDDRFGRVGRGNADGRASLASFQGELYAGSSTNGRLYRLR
tara:strand:- start:54 stop:320 length:267 start_codon:yes stop_codon:yes gene_type:complete